MYTFVKTQLKRCPSVTGWYLVVTIADIDTIIKIHKTVICDKVIFNLSKHPQDMVNWVNLSQGWLRTVEELLGREGAFLINMNGGVMAFSGIKVIQELVSEHLVWPSDDQEIIEINTWPGGKHYYLHSSSGRLFPEQKYDSVDDAIVEASKFVSKESIKVSTNYGYTHEGD